MKLILSRKGFDSTSGGRPSPIFPDGSLVSIPIPEPRSGIQTGLPYDRIPCRGFGTLADVCAQLGVAPEVRERGAHVDPDLVAGARHRPAGWRAAFGQAGAAEAHLRNQGVGAGDVFLFFGLFRRTLDVAGSLRWDPSAGAEHVIFGWLCVGEVITVAGERRPELVETHGDHPHVTHPYGPTDAIYLAADSCTLRPGAPGAGTCESWSATRRLSAPGAPPTNWRLPIGCHPARGEHPLSYHGDPSRWSVAGDHALLRSVSRGQEFVVDATDPWRDWARTALDA